MSRIRSLWGSMARLPGGARLFSAVLGRMAPYSGSIRPLVRELRPGYARVEMRDRRGVRNHLRSVHAVAVANLAELASGLALNVGLPTDARAILVSLSVEYLKKARGALTAEAEVDLPLTNERRECAFESVVRDGEGEVVARAAARWLIGPV